MILTAGLLIVRRRSLYAWIALLAAMVMGGITFADFRAIGDLGSGLSRRMDIVGQARPSLGITLVAASALLGIVASGAGIAASRAPTSNSAETRLFRSRRCSGKPVSSGHASFK